MNKKDKTFSPFDFVISLMQILETKRIPSFCSRFAYHFAIILYFGQMFSYLIKLNFTDFNDSKLVFSSGIFFLYELQQFPLLFQRKMANLGYFDHSPYSLLCFTCVYHSEDISSEEKKTFSFK